PAATTTPSTSGTSRASSPSRADAHQRPGRLRGRGVRWPGAGWGLWDPFPPRVDRTPPSRMEPSPGGFESGVDLVVATGPTPPPAAPRHAMCGLPIYVFSRSATVVRV